MKLAAVHRAGPSRLLAQPRLTRSTTSLYQGSLSPSRAPSTINAARALAPFRPLPQSHHPASQRTYASSSLIPGQPLLKTPLYDLHMANGAKMVPFGGFHMPVQYASHSVSASHLFTRSHASLFDVSHMVQRIFRGPSAAAFLARVTPSNPAGLPEYASTLSVLLHPETGGIVDDTIITRLPASKEDGIDVFYVVTNAACREKDDAYLKKEQEAFFGGESSEGEMVAEKLDGFGLIALQGPLSEEILAGAVGQVDGEAATDLKKLHFGRSMHVRIKLPGGLSEPLLVARGGYTGEDGFEISIPAEQTVEVTHALLSGAGPEKLRLAGLGARDSLRLEAGMCLYGHDLDDTTTPVEAGLSWVIPKERRGADAGFHGAKVIASQLVLKSKGGSGVTRRRVGFVVEGPPAREGAEILVDGQEVGKITSGCPSPSLGKNIAMGYIKDGMHKSGTEVIVRVRGKERKAVVTKMPFIATKYWKGIAPA